MDGGNRWACETDRHTVGMMGMHRNGGSMPGIYECYAFVND
jgi:hypothetical protein